MKKIPFNLPGMIGREAEYLKQACLSGHFAGNGQYSKKCEELLEDKLKCQKVFLTSSCTTALEMVFILFDVKDGDEVIMPTYAFPSLANAILLRGGKPVFVDIRQDTLNIDENKIEEAITSRTKVIAPIHYAGVPSEMERIMKIAKARNLLVIEDAAGALDSRYKGRFLGTIAELGAISFNETKNYVCGEGGAILINDKKYNERAELVREKGTNRAKCFRGEIENYEWVDVGSSFVLADILAAFLLAQMEEIDVISAKRKKIFEYYCQNLKGLEEKGMVSLPHFFPEALVNYHMFYLLLNNRQERDVLRNKLKEAGIMAACHYGPLHLSPMGRKIGYTRGMFPVAENISERLLRLPFYNGLVERDQERVVEQIKNILLKRS
ncbi:MAG: dTDP-4-amino-4,6-dideoxygalactose transaminase [bacterium]